MPTFVLINKAGDDIVTNPPQIFDFSSFTIAVTIIEKTNMYRRSVPKSYILVTPEQLEERIAQNKLF